MYDGCDAGDWGHYWDGQPLLEEAIELDEYVMQLTREAIETDGSSITSKDGSARADDGAEERVGCI